MILEKKFPVTKLLRCSIQGMQGVPNCWVGLNNISFHHVFAHSSLYAGMHFIHTVVCYSPLHAHFLHFCLPCIHSMLLFVCVHLYVHVISFLSVCGRMVSLCVVVLLWLYSIRMKRSVFNLIVGIWRLIGLILDVVFQTICVFWYCFLDV